MPLIVLDAGHGGANPGATYKGRKESEDALALTLAVGSILEENGGPAGGGHAAALLPGARPAAPGDLPPRMRPIYYVWAASPDHGVSGINKTAGRRPAVFAKYGVWSRGRG